MIQNDYLVRMFVTLAAAIRDSLLRAKGDDDPEGAAMMLEETLADATEIDGSVLLKMAPETMVLMLQMSQTDPRLMGYVSRTLLLESTFLEQAGRPEDAALRKQQALALAEAYGIDLDMSSVEPDALDEFFSSMVPEESNSEEIGGPETEFVF